MATSFDLNTRISEVQNLIITAYQHYCAWWIYIGKPTRGKYLDAMNEYPGFFQVSINAHFNYLFICCAKIVDTHKDVMSLVTTFELARRDGKLSQETIDFIEEGLKADEATINGIKLVRNKCSAHFDHALDTTAVFDRAKLKPNDIRDFIKFANEAMNRIDGDLNRNCHALSDLVTNDMTQMLDTLKRVQEQR